MGERSAFRRLINPARILALAVGIAACEAREAERPVPPGAVDTVAARAAIDSLRSGFQSAVAAGRYESLGGMLAEGAVMVRPGGPQWDSAFASSDLPFPPGATLDIVPIETRIINAEWAYEFGNTTLRYTPPGAAAPRPLTDTYLILLRNTGNGWKIYREVASSNLPPPSSAR